MKSYLVTGAAGFIGSRLAAHLIDEGHKVVTIDNLSTGKADNIPEKVEFLKGDCFDPKLLRQLESARFDAIFHIAGQSSGEISFENPVYDLQTNGQSTLQLLQLCRKIGCSKFIYASSMSVYGDVPHQPIAESHYPQPKSFYAVGKLASEQYLRIYAEEFGFSTAALRLFNVYGPGQNLDNLQQGMVSIFLAQALNTKKIHVKGSKNRFRDFVYIDDVVNAFVKAEIGMKEASFSLFNICSGTKTTIEKLVEAITSNFNERIPVKYEGNTLGDQFGIFGNGVRARDEIHWEASTPFSGGIEAMVRWAKNRYS